jgi:hypothetical protein
VPSLHLAVAPVGSVLPALAVGADLVDDFAAVAAGAAGAAVAAGAAATVLAAGAGAALLAGAAVDAVAGFALVAFCTPPWPLQVPLPEDVVVVPSEHVVVAPVAAGAAGVAAAGAVVFAAFCTPPWPLQVPLPVDVVVVPSLHVVGAGSAAKLGSASASISKGAATRAATVIFFILFSARNACLQAGERLRHA